MPKFEISNLVGCWNVKRHIIDYRHDDVGHFKGAAEISLSNVVSFITESNDRNTLLFVERGQLSYAKNKFSTFRKYKILFGSEGVNIYFNSNQEFFFLRFGQSIQQFSYNCNHDLYSGNFKAIAKNLFQLKWKVKGPRKKYYSNSIYRKT